METVADLLTTTTRKTWTLETFLSELLEQEIEGRSQRRVEHLHANLGSFRAKKLPMLFTRQLAQRCSG